MLTKILFLVSIVLWAILLVYRSKFFLHMMQLEGYRNNQYSKWMSGSSKVYPEKHKKSFIAIIIISIVYIILSQFTKNDYILYSYGLVWIICMLTTLDLKKEEAKKELVFTPRAKRLFTSNFVVVIIQLVIVLLIYNGIVKDKEYYLPIILFTLAAINYFQGKNMILANVLVKPVEKRVNMYYFEKARDKVKSMDKLKVIGITGSFGKTSTKFITANVLSEKFNVLKTPESYNTPMGISKVINNDLTEDVEVFVAEMGARNIGDIKELGKLTSPQIGVITSIGPAHLETFKNIDNIMKTKYELIEELPADGVAIFNYDNEYIKKLADKTFKEKILYGIGESEELDIYAKDIEVSKLGSTFTLASKDGEEIRCTTKLLGKHNIYNLLAGACVGKALGLTMDEIKRGIEKVEPIPHRLNIINPGTGVIIIDDAFNSNPIGARAALDVLSQFKEGKKIIITPGMVELGEREEEANRELGANIGKVCDFAILVGGNRTKPIYEGLMDVGYSKDCIFVVKNLDEATMELQKVVKPNDVVLFENDLPDNYEE
nr:UDP-N-acetylmuramoyl-tripeptide--D-alanyl-D-alanine ligase [Anaerosalibacter sp. Marseille-P3206]